MYFILEILSGIILFFNEISIYLLLGFLVAGILHVLFSESIINKHLGQNTLGSVIKSTLFGIPLPLCSCSVVPVAASLKKRGASKGASVSFLISTPQVGADSFMVTYSLLGPIFAFFRIIASLITALFAGIIVNAFEKKSQKPALLNQTSLNQISESRLSRLKSLFSYIEYELLGSLANTIIIGIIIAGIIYAIIPDQFFELYLENSFLSMILMLILGIPLYVCAAASTPIAASLIMKGMAPGAALVFLLTGPATNAVTISTVIRTLGRKVAIVYLASIAVISLILGHILNIFTAKYGFSSIIMIRGHEMLPEWLKIAGSIILTCMILLYYFKIKILPKKGGVKTMAKNRIRLNVEGMTCMHCSGNVKKAVESVKGASNVRVDLESKYVEFNNDVDTKAVKLAIINAGYSVL